MSPHPDISLNLLRVFGAVGEHLHISRAAESLHVSQPAVSKAVRELERQLGVSLLDRGTRAVVLTEAGRDLLRHARVILSVKKLAEEELRLHLGLERGRLRVGASTTVSMYYLPAFVAAFRDLHPGVEIEMTTANTTEIADGLAAYAYDLALVEGPVRRESLVVRRWLEDELIVIASPRHSLARTGSVALAALQERDWVIREEGSGTGAVQERALRGKGIRYRSILRLNSTEAIIGVVAASSSLLALVSRKAAEDRLALGRIVALPVKDLRVVRNLSFLSCRGRVLSPAAQAFATLLQKRNP
jgi:DNA-binding transcriptional LysR family regulator